MNESLERIAEIRNDILLLKVAHKHKDEEAFNFMLQDIEDKLKEIEDEQVRLNTA